jgi:hypothetical protein
MIETLKQWGLNTLNIGFTYAVLSEWIDLFVAVVVGITLVWMNVERALKVRADRKKNIDKK